MGRKNLILGNASGKLGDVVFYRDGGEQRFRTRVTPANPQSMAQQSQRSRLGGVTNTFRAMKGVLADSFENKAVNQSAFNAFSASALPTAPYLIKEAAAAGCAYPMPMAISRGSLPQPFENSLDEDSGGIFVNMPGIAPGLATGNTVGSFSKALIDWKPCVFRDGATIVLVVVHYVYQEVMGEDAYKPEMTVNKFVLDSSSTTSLPTTIGLWELIYSQTAQRFTFDADGVNCVAAAFVVDSDNEGLHVSSCEAVLSTPANMAYENYIGEAARIAAAESYGGSNQRCVL